jgi:hypothetical protein
MTRLAGGFPTAGEIRFQSRGKQPDRHNPPNYNRHHGAVNGRQSKILWRLAHTVGGRNGDGRPAGFWWY